MIRVEVTPQSETRVRIRLHRANDQVDRGINRGIHAATIHLAGYIKSELLSGQVLQRRTGNLSRAVVPRMEGPDTGVVGVGKEAPYGRFQEYGTKPYVIEPKRAKALRFETADGVIFARRVNHPGLKERSFMRRGLSESTGRIKEIIQKFVNEALKQ